MKLPRLSLSTWIRARLVLKFNFLIRFLSVKMYETTGWY